MTRPCCEGIGRGLGIAALFAVCALSAPVSAKASSASSQAFVTCKIEADARAPAFDRQAFCARFRSALTRALTGNPSILGGSRIASRIAVSRRGIFTVTIDRVSPSGAAPRETVKFGVVDRLPVLPDADRLAERVAQRLRSWP